MKANALWASTLINNKDNNIDLSVSCEKQSLNAEKKTFLV